MIRFSSRMNGRKHLPYFTAKGKHAGQLLSAHIVGLEDVEAVRCRADQHAGNLGVPMHLHAQHMDSRAGGICRVRRLLINRACLPL